MDKVQALAEKVVANVEKVIIGKHREVQLAWLALLCQGHLLIEDVPGVGKTMLARAIAKSIGCTFRRIQFTPDMLPSDVTGVSVFNQKTREFEFRPGPVMAQVVLTDEINRATPKTQSALLEAMEERQVTVDGVTYPMEDPFLVMATQNPIEYEGTFPLPEAQLDRFMLRISLGYPRREDEIAILDSQQYRHPIESIDQVVSVEELRQAQKALKEVYVDPLIKEYIVALVAATRQHPDIYLGASPRGSLALYQTSRALAAVQGRDYVIPDDVKALIEITLAHRLIVSPSARIKDVSSKAVAEEIGQSVPVPGARVKAQR
ncbi:MAG: AAA family ATPase [Chloroflexota bacterium]